MPGWHPVLPRLSAVAVSGCSKQTSTLLPPQAAVCCNSSSHIKLIFIPLLWWGGGINVDGHYKGFMYLFLKYEIIWNIAVTLSCRRVENTSTLQTAANRRSQSVTWSGWTVPFSCDRFPWRRSVLHKLEILQHLTWSDQCALNDSWNWRCPTRLLLPHKDTGDSYLVYAIITTFYWCFSDSCSD